MLISARELSKRYGARQVLDRITLTVEPRDRIGLIGINGSGKTTLARVLVGRDDADDGEIQRRRGLTTSIVEQLPSLDPSLRIQETILQGFERNRAKVRELEAIVESMGTASSDELHELIELQHELSSEIEQSGGWDVEHVADAMLSSLSLPPKDRVVGSLSLGERRRLAIGIGLIERPDLLVLDEPTNHLDLAAIEWLEERLVAYPGGLVLITHDRYFLDRVATRMFEIDRGDLRQYSGNYTEYMIARAEREAMDVKSEHRRVRAIESELEWVRKKAPARTTKQKARLDRFDAMVAARPKASVGELRLRLPHPPRIGKTILELDGVSYSIGGRKLIDDLTLRMKPQDRIGIVGPNGVGKTTLLKIIMGELAPDLGGVVQGANTKIVYVDQGRAGLDNDHSVIEEVSGEGDHVAVGDEIVSVHSFLDQLLFDSAAQRTKIGALSGGERSRVALAKALRVAGNLLILDEPTNDLDLPTLRVIEEALVDYPGCALVVSHDRYFLDRISTAILAFEGEGRVVLYEGSYANYRERPSSSSLSEARAPTVETTVSRVVVAKKKRSYKENLELEGIEARILEAEALVQALEAEVSDPLAAKNLGAGFGARIRALETAKSDVETIYARWAELDSIPQR